ncbi:pheST operon leader peptide PheM [Providencia alcalifaciens]|nr:pheST operon leader peptide PheM [Providencia alcalifaciens]
MNNVVFRFFFYFST